MRLGRWQPCHSSGGGMPSEQLQQRRLAAAVVSDQPERGAMGDVDRDVLEGPELVELLRLSAKDALLERRVPLVAVPAELLRDAVDGDRRVAHSSSLRSRPRFRYVNHAAPPARRPDER